MQIRCPHCRHPVEVVDSKLLDEVTCPSCGSNISLVSKESTVAHTPATTTAAYTATSPRRLGHFELLEQVGVGGFGAVWKARDTVLDRIVALKVPRRGQLEAAETEFFLRDARAAAQLRHPNIVSVHEVGRDGGTVFIASDFIDGANLREWLSARPLTIREAAELVAQVAEAVQHAHERGVVHRDLKPGNILMDQAGRPHVADFGMAKRETGEITMTLDGQILGTPAYMSPEQARGKAHEATAASDVYSLGVILFELLTGELPFRGEKRMLILQILNDEPPSPRKLNGRVPRDLETICLKAMAKEPGRRYGAAKDLAGDLQRFLAGQPILARPVGSVERAWRWSTRNPVVAGLLAAVALSLISGTIVSTLYANRASEREAQANLEKTRADRKAAEALTEKRRADDKAGEAIREKQQAERQLLRAEWLLYASHISSAQREWETSNARVAWEHLNACRRDFRGWEHDYLYTLFNQNQQTLRGHTAEVTSAAFSPDNLRIASAGKDGTIRLWDVAAAREASTIKVHAVNEFGIQEAHAVLSVAFSPDGKWLASGSGDNAVRVWNAANGEKMLTLQGHRGAVRCVAFSSDGERIASGSGLNFDPYRRGDNTVRVWNATTGEEIVVFKGHAGEVFSVAFSPDGKQIISGSDDKTLRVWNATTGEETLKVTDLGRIVSVAFSPDGKWILVGCNNNALRMLDAADGQELRRFRGIGNVCAFSSDGSRIVCAGRDDDVHIFSAVVSQDPFKLKGHTAKVTSVAFSSDGNRIVSGSWDHSVKVWSGAMSQEPLSLRGHAGTVLSVDYSPDGKQIISGCGDKTVNVWDATNGQLLKTIPALADYVWGVAYSPDGKQIVGGGSDNALRVWDVNSGEVMLTLQGHGDEVSNVDFSPNGMQIFSASYDNTLKVWDAKTGQVIRTIKGAGPTMALSPDGRRILSGKCDDRVKPFDGWTLSSLTVWDATSGQELLTIPTATGVTRMSFSPDGKRIVSNAFNNLAKVWDAASGKELLALQGHTGRVRFVSFSPDGKRIISCGDDSTLKAWDATSGQETLSLKSISSCVAFSPDGKRIAGAGDTFTIWDATFSQAAAP